VVVQSEGVFLSIVEYLEQSGSSSEDEFAIPIAYRYETGPFAEFRSFNNKESGGCYNAFKKHIEKGFFDTVNLFADTYALLNSKKKVKLVTLKDQKVRGVVCSANEPPPNPQNAKELPVSCKDTILTRQAQSGSLLAFRCPVGCNTVESLNVYAGKDNTFGENSSICKAAAYMGMTKEEEESTVLIKVTSPKEKFQGISGEQNGVKSKAYVGVNAKVFQFVVKALEDECPNLKTQKAFISFDEIVSKVQRNKKQKSSFIEADESVNALEKY